MTHKFEKGISINVNLPDTLKSQKLMMHHLKNSDGMIIDVDAGTKFFTALNLYPENDEKLYFSKLSKSGSLNKVPLYVQFYPNHIPNHSFSIALKKPEYFTFENYNQANIFSKLNERIVLDEVVVKANLKEQRKLELRRNSSGRAFILDDTDRNLSIGEYIKFRTALGWRINNPYRDTNFIGNSPNAGLFFIDDMLILDYNILFEYRASYVEYVDFPMDGSVRIYTSPELMFKSNNLQTVNEISFPLTYAVAEKFYVPKYQSYKDDFFQKYGVIDWKPINKIDKMVI
ncbi:MAG: hypothetical protein HC798_01525 [Polaribacter sp.]|nr:hypothetical protein [Polaribacter sp.]